ncbi:hypothetical protein D3C73_797830 [compost metagenome]
MNDRGIDEAVVGARIISDMRKSRISAGSAEHGRFSGHLVGKLSRRESFLVALRSLEVKPGRYVVKLSIDQMQNIKALNSAHTA